ncbi:unnamed protein product [Bursaphelenchus xylophilus]|uniref:(pine wood nematode) hypothetical protein n=1 Tax=Bursaphelenchus xylophilus TaxID=6326 RepID=A0A7I8XNT1_BURXY|nr:unnamed protein product [Bursaphelenchus xylophilus]CAG9088488.1 unnamed protein product [Bursaphelenchus xylophilus]
MLVKSPMFRVSETVHATRNRKFDEPERREITSTRRTTLRAQQEVFQQDSDKKNEDSDDRRHGPFDVGLQQSAQ